MYIQWIDYTEVDGQFVFDDGTHVIAFEPVMVDGIGMPPCAALYARLLYGPDCMDVIRSPTTVDGWRVPSQYISQLMAFRADGDTEKSSNVVV